MIAPLDLTLSWLPEDITSLALWFADLPIVIQAAIASAMIFPFTISTRRRHRSARRQRYSANLHRHHIQKSRDVLNTLKGIPAWQAQLAHLRKIHHTTFEELLLSTLQDAGFKIARNRRYTHDGGIDGRFFLPGGKDVLIQAKRYANGISSEDVQSFTALCERSGKLGLFIHTGKTPKHAWGVLGRSPGRVTVLSGQRLIRFLEDPSAEISRLAIKPADQRT